MYLGLEEAAKRTGRRIHLLQTGRFPNEGIEREFRDGARRFAPSVNPIFLDGRDETVCRDVWYAADVFTSLSDNVQESFGLTPIEAMAAGLPCVVTDWNGYRDTVRDGEDGFAIPTWLPLPGSGGDMVLQTDPLVGEAERDRNYNHYCGLVSQCTAVDVAKTAEAYTALAENEDLRLGMGNAGRQHARQTYDWSVIVRAYQDLWRELAHIRARTREVAPVAAGRPIHPLRDDPFALFAGYPSATVDGETAVRLTVPAGTSLLDHLNNLRAASMNDFAVQAMLPEADLGALLDHLADGAAHDVFNLAETLPEDMRFRLPRTLVWLAKLGVIALAAPDQGQSATPPPPTGAAAGEASRLVELGRGAAQRGAWPAAADYFTQALRVDPGDARANTEIGKLQAQQGELEAAAGSFRRALNRAPGDLEAQRNLGKVLLLGGRADEGIANLEQVAGLAPEDGETQYLLGAAYRRAGEVNRAMARLERCLELDGDRADALTHLGLARKNLDRRDDAEAAFRRALDVDPRNVFARAALISMEAEDAGRRRLAASERGRRVALHLNQRGQFPALEPLFAPLTEDHWPMITGDGRELRDFDPDVVVIAGEHAAALRDLAGNATIVNLGPGLAAKNFLSRVTDPGDAICVSSPQVAADLRRRSGLDGERVWITGLPWLDALFRGDSPALPDGLSEAAPTVLYAPTDRPLLSSAGLLVRRPVDLIRGERRDINVILKPHPNLCEAAPAWLAQWEALAEDQPNLHVCTDPTVPAAAFMAHAGLMISDASSAMLEFLALDRPLALIANPERFCDESHYDPSGYEWSWRDMGDEIHDVELLSERVWAIVDGDDSHAEARGTYRAHLFGDMTDGRAAERIAALLSGLNR